MWNTFGRRQFWWYKCGRTFLTIDWNVRVTFRFVYDVYIYTRIPRNEQASVRVSLTIKVQGGGRAATGGRSFWKTRLNKNIRALHHDGRWATEVARIIRKAYYRTRTVNSEWIVQIISRNENGVMFLKCPRRNAQLPLVWYFGRRVSRKRSKHVLYTTEIRFCIKRSDWLGREQSVNRIKPRERPPIGDHTALRVSDSSTVARCGHAARIRTRGNCSV